MKYTVLDLTQNILSSLNGQEVNSISDTAESRQVAQVIKTAYFNLIARANLPKHLQLLSLTSSGDSDLPVVMYKPDNVSLIDWIKYDVAEVDDPVTFWYVTILPIQQFVDMQHNFNSDEDNVDSLVIDDQTYYYKNDKHPKFCTILNNRIILFDSIDLSVDTILQESKTMVYGRTVPTFELNDSFVPSLDDEQFPLLLNESKALAFVEMKQMAHEPAMRESRRQWQVLMKSKALHKTSDLSLLPNFGRK